MRSRNVFVLLLFAFMLSTPIATVSAGIASDSSMGYGFVFLEIQHDRLDRYWIPQGKEHTVNIHMEVRVYDIVDHVELWFWMPHTLDVTDWETNIGEAVPTGFEGTYTGPNYEGDGWYLCVLSPDGDYFTFDDWITLDFTITIPSTLTPRANAYTLLKFYGGLTGDFDGEDTLLSGVSREKPFPFYFNIEPFIYPVDTPVSFSDPDTTGMKFTFDVSPKLIQIPFGVEQTWHIEAEFEVLVDDKIEWVLFMPHLLSDKFDPVPAVVGFVRENGWVIENYHMKIIDESGVHDVDFEGDGDGSKTIDGYYGYHSFLDGYNTNEDIDGQWGDSDYFITFYRCGAVAPEDSYFSKGDIIRFSFDYTSPPIAPGSTPHELIKVSYVTSWNNVNPYDVEKKASVYFELGSHFVVPEVPLGTLVVIITALIARIIYTNTRITNRKTGF